MESNVRNILLAVTLVGCTTDHIHPIQTNAVYIDGEACVINAVDQTGIRSVEEMEEDFNACIYYHNLLLEEQAD